MKRSLFTIVGAAAVAILGFSSAATGATGATRSTSGVADATAENFEWAGNVTH